MPRNAFQRVIFALLSVIFTVHGYVFYSLYVVNGATLMAVTGESGVLAAIASQGGVYMCGRFLPIWAVVLTEFCLAFLLETTMGSPCSFRLAAKNFDPRQTSTPPFFALACRFPGTCPEGKARGMGEKNNRQASVETCRLFRKQLKSAATFD